MNYACLCGIILFVCFVPFFLGWNEYSRAIVVVVGTCRESKSVESAADRHERKQEGILFLSQSEKNQRRGQPFGG